ncbi:hypothetical protein TNCV_4243801 [Trichonephila clavipes]|nr:hypothetical protein TNCV_4243801 [Trichonephila clavipes]
MWFMHDGAPVRFPSALRNDIHTTYRGRWIGHVRRIARLQSLGFLMIPPQRRKPVFFNSTRIIVERLCRGLSNKQAKYHDIK